MPTRQSNKGPFWRAKIAGYGRVESADIEMAPLVLLVGRNNTGKSYIASLLWAFLNFEDTFLGAREAGDLLPEWFKAITSGEYDAENNSLLVTPTMFDAWVERVLRDRLSSTVKRVLSYNPATIVDLKFQSAGLARDCLIRRTPMDVTEDYTAQWGVVEQEGAFELEFSIAEGEWGAGLSKSMFSSLLGAILDGAQNGYVGANAVYIPAARTGLMLALGPITASALENLGIEEPEERTRLPLPTIRFLQALTRGKRTSSGTRYEEVARFLEKEVLKGRIVRDETPNPSFSYETETELALPLHVTSSMITELAPFMILLQNGRFDRGLIFEEPEAHLHLAAQRSMARAIARLVNLGVPVVVTTHSDTFLQELNILMQLNGHPNRAELMATLGYEESDLVDPSDVRGYEFVDQDGRTHVRATEINAYGVVVPSLNEVLTNLTDELLAIQE